MVYVCCTDNMVIVHESDDIVVAVALIAGRSQSFSMFTVEYCQISYTVCAMLPAVLLLIAELKWHHKKVCCLMCHLIFMYRHCPNCSAVRA